MNFPTEYKREKAAFSAFSLRKIDEILFIIYDVAPAMTVRTFHEWKENEKNCAFGF